MPETEEDRRLRAKGRFAGLLIAGTMLLWLAVQAIGPRIGLDARFAVLFDLIALAAFTFALIVTYQIWRARRDEEG
ncbi:MAG: hypothetical protein CSA72_09750 [Rhodobacterales bacterium]|nr:MAG: hypothetical protein CSA72_09750 [Rhodobacterales bacterium]